MTGNAVGVPLRELAWLTRLMGRAVIRFPGQTALALGAGWMLWAWASPVPVILAAAVLAACLMWARWWPIGFHRFVGGPVERAYWRRSIRRCWADVAVACGLGIPGPARPQRHGRSSHQPAGQPHAVPKLHRVSASGSTVRVRLRPLLGQTIDDVVDAAERLRTAVGASRVRTDSVGANEVALTFSMGDPLAAPFAAARPSRAEVGSHVAMGRAEDGKPWRLPVGPHTLVAGCSGAGKGSVFWSFAFGLAPGVKAGTVRLHGIDLKGGMEILMGAGLFTKRATTTAEAVVLLEDLVRQMRERTRVYAGRVRSHVPTVDEPLHVLMIDELAALTAYCPERELQRRAEMAINLLCSQGRAPGFLVFACLQDPRKEVIPSRGLFTQMVGLRLKDASETAMVLGESALASGAHCHRITRGSPGMGYVLPEDGGYPMRVRAGHVSDQAIRQVAAEFATAVQEPVVVLERDSSEEFMARRSRFGVV